MGCGDSVCGAKWCICHPCIPGLSSLTQIRFNALQTWETLLDAYHYYTAPFLPLPPFPLVRSELFATRYGIYSHRSHSVCIFKTDVFYRTHNTESLKCFQPSLCARKKGEHHYFCSSSFRVEIPYLFLLSMLLQSWAVSGCRACPGK